LTNWQTIKQRIDFLDKLENRRDQGDFDLLKKTERLRIEREIAKLNMRLGGIRKMTTVPKLLFVVDVNSEETAVHEANILGVPIIGVVDTNSNPDPIEYLIPSNDDAIRAIKLLTSKMADAALEGAALRKESMDEEVTDFEAYDYKEFDGMGNVDDEKLLGESTLAKLREQTAEEVVVAEDKEKVVVVEVETTEEVVVAEEKEEVVVVEAEATEEIVLAEDKEEEVVVVEVEAAEEVETETVQVGQDEENE
jgi:small subunit ribosomal protein S2